MKKVAIFDIDGTIFRSSLLIEITEELIERDLFPKKARDLYIKEYKAWHDRKGEYQEYIDGVVEAFMRNIKGVHYRDLVEVSETVVESQEHRVYQYARDLIDELKKKNYYLLAISQSPKITLDVFCKRHGFDKVYGRIYELGPEDCFTGNITDLHLIQNKANIVRRAVERQNLTLKDSIAVGDTEGDIPMLELAEQPIAFNPSAELYKHAKRVGWKVVVERKDVIYEL